ncbi:hypothetical protein Tco_0548397 [Tanacetum coccineum]
MHLVDPPSPNYVPGPKEPVQAPLLPDYVPGPEYPEYLAPSDVEIPVEDQPYAADASPTTLSLGYIADFDPKEDPEDESEDGPTDYPANGGDDDDDESSGDDADDEDEEEASEEDKEEEEEHLALADSTAVPLAVDPVPPLRRQIHLRLMKAAWLLVIPTPPPSPLTPLSSPLPQIPSPPFLLPLPPTYTSPTYIEAPLGYRASEIRLRTASPLPSSPLPPPSLPLLPPIDHREEVPEADIPPRKRLCLTAPTLRFEVRESSTAVAARQPGLGAARTTDYGFIDMVDDALRRHVPREVRHCITNTWDEFVDSIQEGALTTLEGDNARVTEFAKTHEQDTQDLYAYLKDAQDSRAHLLGRVDILFEDRQFHQLTVILIEDEALVSREAWPQAMGYSVAFHYKL